MCVGIIRNNSLVGGRARAESNPGHWARHALLHMAAECVNHSATKAGRIRRSRGTKNSAAWVFALLWVLASSICWCCCCCLQLLWWFVTQVGVHIADVSHFIRPGTALDQEAASRGTTVYLIDKVPHCIIYRLSCNSFLAHGATWWWYFSGPCSPPTAPLFW